MCLITNQKEPLIATKDIECYKVVRIDPDYPEYWTCLYVFDRFEFDRKINANGLPLLHVDRFLDTGYYITEGFFHATLDRNYAECLYEIESHNSSFLEIVKCIIPKGSSYYLSSENADICSPCIIVLKNSYSYDKNMKCKQSSFIIYFKTIFNKFLNIFK